MGWSLERNIPLRSGTNRSGKMWWTNSSQVGRANGMTTPSYRARAACPREQQHTARATATTQGSATTTATAGGSATATADPVVGRAAAVDPAMGRTAAADSATGRSGGGMRGGGQRAAADPAMGTVAACEEELAGEERRRRARRRSRGGGGSGDGAAADSAMGRSCGGLRRGARGEGAAAACEEEVEGRRRIRRWEGAAATFPLALARCRLFLLLAAGFSSCSCSPSAHPLALPPAMGRTVVADPAIG
ncbi:hypothetical protein DAI22_01g281901 [Oryza sativa Japonica Group]|jgi:hypothetical protein|nr:hypothetical protein DAI22_01g281901 [Oryza sativa Japonica Group]